MEPHLKEDMFTLPDHMRSIPWFFFCGVRVAVLIFYVVYWQSNAPGYFNFHWSLFLKRAD